MAEKKLRNRTTRRRLLQTASGAGVAALAPGMPAAATAEPRRSMANEPTPVDARGDGGRGAGGAVSFPTTGPYQYLEESVRN